METDGCNLLAALCIIIPSPHTHEPRTIQYANEDGCPKTQALSPLFRDIIPTYSVGLVALARPVLIWSLVVDAIR
jgi:hypothetical protein